MGSLGEIMKLCRLCLVKDQVNVPIFEGAGDIRKISQKIGACLPVKVTKDDKLPKKICNGCSHKLDMVYQFWNTTTSSEKQLLEWVNNPSSRPLEERGVVAEHIVLKQEVDNGDSEALDAGEFIDVNETFETIGFAHDDDDEMSNENIDIKTENDSRCDEPPIKKHKTVSLSSAESEEDADDPSDAYNRDDSDEDDNDVSEAQPAFVNVAEADQQPGPSGVGKASGEAPSIKSEFDLLSKYEAFYNLKKCVVLLGDIENVDPKKYKLVHKKHKVTVEVNPVNIIRDSRRNKYKCEVCDLKFKDYVMLESHKEIHKKEAKEVNAVEEDVVEPSSSSTTTSSEESNKEPENISSDESEKDVHDKNICVYCNRSFKYNWTLAKHLRQHDQLACKDCLILFKTKVELDRHLNEVHRLYTCKVCTQKFYSFVNCKNHTMEKHSDYNESEDRTCNICNIQFYNFEQLVEHNFTLQHQFKCRVCKKEVYTNNLLNSHKNVHLNAPPNILVCKNCNSIFTEVTELYDHSQQCKKSSHVTCEICSSPFMDAETLERHTATHFTAPKKLQPKPIEHKCTLCNKLFASEKILQDHLKNHLTVHTSPNTLSSTFQLPKTVATTGAKTIPLQIQLPGLTTNNLVQQTSIAGVHTANPQIMLNQNNSKLLLTSEDKRCFILTPVSSVAEGGLIKYTVTQSPMNTQPQLFQGIPALQPINNFLQPAINQTIVLPPAQNNSQISITNKTYNTGVSSPSINSGTANIVFKTTTPVSQSNDVKPVTKTYQPRFKTTPTFVKIRTADIKQGAVDSNVKPSTSSVSDSSTNVVINKNNPIKAKIIIKTIDASTKFISPPNLSSMTVNETLVDPLMCTNAEASTDNNAETFKPKIFLKPLSQLLQNPVESSKTLNETDVPSTAKANEMDMPSLEINETETNRNPTTETAVEGAKVEQPDALAGPSKEKGGLSKRELLKLEKKKYKCNMCGIHCKRLGKLIQHQNKYSCKICEFACCKLKSLDSHYKTQHNFKNRCASCDMQFPTNIELQVHKKDVHLCVKCNRCYLDLKKHKTSFKCLNCEFNACDSASLDSHYKLVHSITTRCGPCNSIFYTAESFARHKQEIHYCSKCKTYKMDLNIHKTFCKGISNEDDKEQDETQESEVIELDDSE